MGRDPEMGLQWIKGFGQDKKKMGLREIPQGLSYSHDLTVGGDNTAVI